MTLTYAFEADALSDGELRTMPGVPHVAIYRVGDEFFATQDSCSHEEWSLGEDGELEGHEVLCSLHMARFDIRDGRPLCLPALKPLRTYPVVVTDGRVMVDVDGEGEGAVFNVTAQANDV